jgi:hypothetical protein
MHGARFCTMDSAITRQTPAMRYHSVGKVGAQSLFLLVEECYQDPSRLLRLKPDMCVIQ